jgi:hypothetical protein
MATRVIAKQQRTLASLLKRIGAMGGELVSSYISFLCCSLVAF